MLFNFGRLPTSDPNILDVLDSFCGRKNARLGVNGNPARVPWKRTIYSAVRGTFEARKSGIQNIIIHQFLMTNYFILKILLSISGVYFTFSSNK